MNGQQAICIQVKVEQLDLVSVLRSPDCGSSSSVVVVVVVFMM